MLFILTTILIILCFIEYYMNHNENARRIKRIPGSRDVFLFGNTFAVIGKSPVDLFKLGRTMAAQYNGIYRFFAFGLGAVGVYNHQDVETVVSGAKHHRKSFVYNFLKPWLQDGLLVSNGSKWQERRKILTAAFHFNVLRKYFPVLEDNSRKLLTELEESNGKPIDIVHLLSDFTLHSICETAMGVQLDSDKSGMGHRYKQAILENIKLLVKRFTSVVLYADAVYNITFDGLKQWKYLSTIHGFTKNVIKTRKENIKNDTVEDMNETEQDEFDYKPKKKAAMLDLLISAENDGLIDDRGIQEEVDTFMFEGHDTTASGLTFCLLSLAEHPQIQAKVIEEMQFIFNNSNRPATTDDLTKMSYLELCIKESLRLYPPVPFISRTLTEDTKLSNYDVSAGTMIHVHIFDLHRQESLFKDPLKFDPDRFLPENFAGVPTYGYIPFSAGPRNCIGQKFAMMEMKLALSSIFRNYKVFPVTTSKDLEFMADLVLRNTKPIYLKFVKINQ